VAPTAFGVPRVRAPLRTAKGAAPTGGVGSRSLVWERPRRPRIGALYIRAGSTSALRARPLTLQDVGQCEEGDLNPSTTASRLKKSRG